MIICGIIHAPQIIYAQATDTLVPVKVFTKMPYDIGSSPVNVQQLNKENLEKLNSLSVADALKYFSGVVIKDYGGIGGLKTISVRSLGANHTGVMYDGIMIGDAQGGQIDLGRFSLDNISLVQLFNNQPPDILLPARSYASASVLALLTSANNRNERPKTTFGLKCRFGSFGFIDPSFYYTKKINEKLWHAVHAEYQSAKGNFSFIDYENSHSKKKRTNADIKSYRLEYDAAYTVNDSNQVKLKVYYYNSKRGLPGAVILYNNSSDERSKDENFFSQLSWKRNLSNKARILVSGKYSADYKYYLDPSYPNYAGKIINEFHQKEFYLSAAFSYNIFPGLSASYALDYFRSELKRTDSFTINFPNPERDNMLQNIALQWKRSWFEVNGNLLSTYASEKVTEGPTAGDRNQLTPALSASIQPSKKLPFRIRASYKNIFRIPTFDDLYYTNIGNTKLRPEYAKLYAVGIAYSTKPVSIFESIAFTTDVYYNKITDKILAVPRQSLGQWTMLNIAAVDARGLDGALHLIFRNFGRFNITANLSYSYQRSLDVSDSKSSLYNTQLPYTPEHSGSINLNAGYSKFVFSYNVIASSYRYRLGDRVPDNLLNGWATHDASLSYAFASKKYWDYKFIAEANNVYNKQYEIIKYYPMPRFNYRFGITASFKKTK